jgi:hypothetical protein
LNENGGNDVFIDAVKRVYVGNALLQITPQLHQVGVVYKANKEIGKHSSRVLRNRKQETGNIPEMRRDEVRWKSRDEFRG